MTATRKKKERKKATATCMALPFQTKMMQLVMRSFWTMTTISNHLFIVWGDGGCLSVVMIGMGTLKGRNVQMAHGEREQKPPPLRPPCAFYLTSQCTATRMQRPYQMWVLYVRNINPILFRGEGGCEMRAEEEEVANVENERSR